MAGPGSSWPAAFSLLESSTPQQRSEGLDCVAELLQVNTRAARSLPLVRASDAPPIAAAGKGLAPARGDRQLPGCGAPRSSQRHKLVRLAALHGGPFASKLAPLATGLPRYCRTARVGRGRSRVPSAFLGIPPRRRPPSGSNPPPAVRAATLPPHRAHRARPLLERPHPSTALAGRSHRSACSSSVTCSPSPIQRWMLSCARTSFSN
eukprot:5494601-Prymnesium_polylepis.1